MLKFENVEIVGWEAAIRGIRNPDNSWEESYSLFNIHRKPNSFDVDTLKPDPPVGTDILGRTYFAPGEFDSDFDAHDMFIDKGERYFGEDKSEKED